jgi:alkylation response protein AidB-like acyl-CoA dehydrogenase
LKEGEQLGIRALLQGACLPDCQSNGNDIGREGMGLALHEVLGRTRTGIVPWLCSLPRGALEAAIEYAREREQFVKRLLPFSHTAYA